MGLEDILAPSPPPGFEPVAAPAPPPGFEPVAANTGLVPPPPAGFEPVAASPDLPVVSPWGDSFSIGFQKAAGRIPTAIQAVGTLVDVGAKKLAEWTGIQGVTLGDNYLPQIVPTTPEFLVNPTPFMNSVSGIAKATQDWIGQRPEVSIQDVLGDWSNLPAFVIQQGIGSVPDMAAAMAAPWLYGVARAGEIAGNRAEADGRANNTSLTDLVVAAPAAAVGTALERFGVSKMLEAAGAGVAAAGKRIGGAMLAAGAGEAIDEGGEYLATNAGTKRGANPKDLGLSMAGGAIAGAGLGGVVRGVHEAGAAVQRTVAQEGDIPAPPPGFEPVSAPTEQVQTPPVSTDTGEAPSVSEVPAPPKPETNPNRVQMKTPDGSVTVDGEYQIVDLKNLQRATGDLQPRDRDRAASDAQIAQIAGNLDPERLLASQETDRGAPIVDENGVILSGNGRTAAIERAKTENPEGYARYQQAISQFGSTEGMETPVLVRRVSGLDQTAKRDFVVKSNKDSKIAMSPSEQAGVDADLVDEGALDTLNPDADLTSLGNQDFVRNILRKMPPAEQAAFVSEDGRLHQQGARRIEAAVFSRAYGDRDLTNRIVEEEGDTGTAKALFGAAPAWAKMRAQAPSQFDLTEQLVAAINAVAEMRRTKTKPDQFFAQQDAFTKVQPETELLARAFWNPNGTRAAAWVDARDFLRSYAEAARREANASGDLLGGPAKTPIDILKGMQGARAKRAADEANAKSAQGNLLAPRPAADVYERLVKNYPRLEEDFAARKDLPEVAGLVTKYEPEVAALNAARDRGEAKDYGGQLQEIRTRFARELRQIAVPPKGKKPTKKLPVPAAAEDVLAESVADPTADTQDTFDFLEENPDPDILKNSRIPRTGLSPTFEDYSFSKGASTFEQAFRAAGVDPERGRLMAPVRQIEILSDLVRRAFGFKAVEDKGIKALDGIDQMLDGFRNLQFMASALGMPNTAFGLGGRVTLTLESFKGRYLGAYYPGDQSIHMPGRSNSFAHEWAHALDHFLLDTLGTKTGQAAKNYLYSHEARSEGLDPTQSVPHAFVNLLNKMFFNNAALAARVAALQVEAAKVNKKTGQPTLAAAQAQAQLDRIADGSSKIHGANSDFLNKARAFDKSGYWQKPTEMLARAFEAYVAHKVEMAGGTNQFITKSDEAYLNNADRRLRETFPKNNERLAIFQAFDDLMGQLQADQLLGTDPVAARPADTDIVDPMKWFKVGLGIQPMSIPAEIRKEMAALGAAMRHPLQALKSARPEIASRAGLNADPSINKDYSIFRRSADALRFIGYTMRGQMKVAVKRAPDGAKPYMQAVVDMFATDPGTGREVTETYEAAVERTSRRDTNELANILKATNLSHALNDVQIDRLRGLMLGEAVPNAPQNEVTAAAGMRRMLNRLWRENTEAGIDMGFVKNTGYLTRIIKQEAVFQDPDGFQRAATDVYRVVFDNDVRPSGDVDPSELVAKIKPVHKFDPARLTDPQIRQAVAEVKRLRKELRKLQKAVPQDQKAIDVKEKELADAYGDLADLIQPEWAAVAAQKWKEKILQGSPYDFNVRGPDANFTTTRTLPPEADRIMERFYMENPVEAVAHYAMQSARKREFVRRVGSPTSGVDDLAQFIRRRGIQDAIAANPRRYDPNTSAGRVNIVRDLTNPATDNRVEMLFKEAIRNKANPEDIRLVRDMIERISGRTNGLDAVPFRRFSSFVYAAGTLSLMPRAVWTSIAEPVSVFMQTRSTKIMFKTFVSYVSEIKRSNPDVRQLAALSEAIGLVTSPYYEGLIHHSMEGTYGDSIRTQRLLSNFFMRTGLTHLTNAQRRASLVGATHFMKDLAKDVNSSDKAKAEMARAELRDLGVPDTLIGDFSTWLSGLQGMPGLDDLNTPAGQIFASAANRFVDQTIQAPKRVDKPIRASSAHGRLLYGLTSFNYAFMRSVHFKQLNRLGRDAQILQSAGDTRAQALAKSGAAVAGTLGLGFGMIALTQLLVSVLREALFNGEKWDEMEAKGELVSWLTQLALSRSGILGALDPFWQAKTGLRYERDLTGLAVGPYLGFFLHGAQGILGMYGGRNSPNTNTSEWNAAKSAYQIFAVPMISYAMTAIPGGPVTSTGLGLGMQKLTSNQSADKFANAITGEKDSRRKARARAAAQGAGVF